VAEIGIRENEVMPDTRIGRRLSLLASLVVVLATFASLTTLVSAQEGESRATQNASRSLPIRHSNGAKLTEQQAAGAGVFFQRCSLCHLAKTSGAGGSKFCCVSSLGPDLSGRFNDLAPDQEKAFKDIILNGGPTYMPAWKYSLTPDEIDDIIAYLKTLG
jgi:mono/diheme cytochrome c family protein